MKSKSKLFKNAALNRELLETETVSLDAMFPSQSQQDIVEISSEDEKENVLTNLYNKRYPDSATKTRNNKLLTEIIIDRVQQP